MNRLLCFLLLLGSGLSGIAQSVPPPNFTWPAPAIDPPKTATAYPLISDLRSLTGTANTYVQVLGGTAMNDGNGGSYVWSPTATGTDDGFTTVMTTGVTTGRWLRIVNPNTVKFSTVLSGQALQSAYNITYPTPLILAPVLIIPVAYSANASVPCWVTNVTNTGFTINFASVPVVGTNNISVGYLVIKQ